MDELRAAIIGYGLAGSVFHAPLIESTEGMRVATIVTRNPGRRESAAREYPEARLLDAPASVWESPEEHDFVVVAAPNVAHAPLARNAIEAGLPVVVDKPLALNAREGRELVDLASGAGVLLTVFHNRRWDSDQLTLRRLVGDGTLGDVYRYESRFERWRPDLNDAAWRDTTTAAEGGGVLLDLGAHLIDQAVQLFGPVVEVHGEVDARRGGASDDDAFVTLRHESGVHSHLWASSVAAAPGPRLRVLGSRAAYVVAEVDSQEDALKAGRRPRPGEPWGVEPESSWGRLVRGDASEAVRSEPGAWPVFYERFGAALREGGPPPVDPADAAQVLGIIDAARSGPDPS